MMSPEEKQQKIDDWGSLDRYYLAKLRGLLYAVQFAIEDPIDGPRDLDEVLPEIKELLKETGDRMNEKA